MTSKTTTLVAALFLAGLGATEAAAQKSDEERIVGTWRIVKARAEGKDLSTETLTLMRLTILADGKLSLALPDKGVDGKYKILGRGQIDIAAFGGNDLTPGVYKFDGDDRVTLSIALDRKGKRPTEFTAEKGSGQFVLVLQRAKPGEEKLTPQEIAKLKEIGERVQHHNNLAELGRVFHNYLAAFGSFPKHAIYSKDGKTPLLSWRVAILPFIEEKALYREFKLDEPWDSPHNRKLIAKMPKFYEPLGAGKEGEGKTHYQVFTGPDTPFDGNKKMRVSDFPDGLSNTILVIDARDPVVWSKPDDLVLPREKDKLPPLGGLFKDAINLVTFDGAVRPFRPNPDPVLLRAAVTPSGGETVQFEKLEK